MNTANEISKRIEDFLNDRCVNGWTVTASKMYDDVRHDVTVEFESMGSAWKFKVSFIAWLENDEVLFEPYDGAGQGEPIHDLLWQWLFWELMKGQE